MLQQQRGRESEHSNASRLTEGDTDDPGNRAAAVGDLARQSHRSLLGTLRRCTGSMEDARDIAQETYLKVLASRHEGAIQSFQAYVWRSALNLATDQGRRRAARERFAHGASFGVQRCAPSAEAVVAARQCLDMIGQALNALPAKCQQAFALRVLEGRPFVEAAQEMRISDRMVKTYVARALRVLRERVAAAERPAKRWEGGRDAS